jgi:hypothetical protein
VARLKENKNMSTLSEVREQIAQLQPQFDAELAAYHTAVRAGDRVSASAALERLRPIGDQLQPLLVDRVNLERQPS